VEKSPESMEYIVTARLLNSRTTEIPFHLEPWGETYTMSPGTAFDIVARGPQGGILEVEVADDYITVYGWPGSTINLFHEGIELEIGL